MLLEVIVAFLVLWLVLSLVAGLFGAFVHPLYRHGPYMPIQDIRCFNFGNSPSTILNPSIRNLARICSV